MNAKYKEDDKVVYVGRYYPSQNGTILSCTLCNGAWYYKVKFDTIREIIESELEFQDLEANARRIIDYYLENNNTELARAIKCLRLS